MKIVIATAMGVLLLGRPYFATAQNVTGQQDKSTANRPDSTTLPSAFPMMRVKVLGVVPEPSKVIDGYTRLVVEFKAAEDDDGSTRDYRRERRDILRRWLAGKAVTRLLSVKTKLVRPDVSLTNILSAVSYGSNSKSGETWTTELNPRRALTPYFRIDADSAINIEAATTLTSVYSVSAAGTFLDLLRRAAKLAVPAAPLITSLNERRFDDASSFVDQSISNLFQQSITERNSADFIMKDWARAAADQPLMTIDLWLPLGKTVAPRRSPPDPDDPTRIRHIGTWTILAVRPVLSVFSDTPLLHIPRDPTVANMTNSDPTPARRVRGRANTTAKAPTGEIEDKNGSLCRGENGQWVSGDFGDACRVMARLEPQAVLNFPVTDGVPLIQALSGDTGIAAARERFIKESDDKAGQAVNANAYALCSLVADKAYRLGFNRMDTAAIMWAYSNQTFVTAKTGKALRNGENCWPLRIAYAFGLPKGGYDESAQPVKPEAISAAPTPPPPPAPTVPSTQPPNSQSS